MTFGAPSRYTYPWHDLLNHHMGQFMDPNSGGINIWATTPTTGIDGQTLGVSHTGYTGYNSTMMQIERWDGSKWEYMRLAGYYPGQIITAMLDLTNAPPRTIPAMGQTLKTADYPELYQAVVNDQPAGNKWHELFGGNGTTEFNCPDLRGVFLRGLDNGKGYDFQAGSRTLGTYQPDGNKSHNHGITVSLGSAGNHSHSTSAAGNHQHMSAVHFIWNVGTWNQGVRAPHNQWVQGQPFPYFGQDMYGLVGERLHVFYVEYDQVNGGGIVHGNITPNEASNQGAIGTTVNGAHSHPITAAGDHSHTASASSTLEGQTEATVKNLTVNYFIAY